MLVKWDTNKEMLLAGFIAILLPLVGFCWVLLNIYALLHPDSRPASPIRWAAAIIVPVLIALYGLKKKSLNESGAASGLIVGFLLTISSFRFLGSLLAFFICASKATKFRSSSKKKLEADFKEGGQRNWVQVFCNGGPASLFAILYLWEIGCVDIPINFTSLYTASWYSVAVLSSLSSSSGDTFASEIGSAMGTQDPFHIILLKRVPRGTNGGISLIGTLSSLFGGFIVGVAFYISLLLSTHWVTLYEEVPQWPVVIYATLAGGLGSLIDSVLGGTLQYSGRHKKLGVIVENKGPDIQHISGVEFLDNHFVNLLSSLLTGLIVPFIAAETWSYFT